MLHLFFSFLFFLPSFQENDGLMLPFDFPPFSCPAFAPYVCVDEMWKVWDQVTLNFLTAFS
jgi:hypothetical protein